ncbi:MAG: type I restriction endonuclease subunit S [Pelatocladus maniniholoensis HA4357-MV3]|uniref:Type I restriction endonuclease subunit S n=1 Tax=Pelatocladus maniniholoensis HA4357-MV3 TaxID=1117104 RepID=A0A9E3HAJ5_9NOST|nr:type I restriction endonuclease subunit S [Pelatocladus maniniholoensis HA4357-MV3]
MNEQKAIADFVERSIIRIDLLSDKIQLSIDHLKEYRTALISAAVTGKIDIREEVA